MQNCVAAIDGKLVVMQAPRSSRAAMQTTGLLMLMLRHMDHRAMTACSETLYEGPIEE